MYRPLPEEMFFYAMADTHFLLYIYDMMRNALVETSDRSQPDQDLIGRVLEKSKEMALSRYESQRSDVESGGGPRGWYSNIVKHPKPLSAEQFSVFKALWKWRDDTARRRDENPGFILPLQALVEISTVLPPDQKALYSLIPRNCYEAKAVGTELWQMIQTAKANGSNSLSLLQFLIKDAESAAAPDNATDTMRDSTPPSAIPVVDVEATKLTRSQLFGEMTVSSLWEEAEPPLQLGNEEYIKLPWQRLRASASMADSGRRLPTPQATLSSIVTEEAHGSRALTSPKPRSDADMEFVLRTGRKRQLPDSESESDSSPEPRSGASLMSGTIHPTTKPPSASVTIPGRPLLMSAKGSPVAASSLESAQDEVTDTKKSDDSGSRHKQTKKSKKKAKRRREGNGRVADGQVIRPKGPTASNDGVVPFDYSKAATVLHSKEDPKVAKNSGPSASHQYFQPRAAEGGPKGARKAPPVPGGKSATFRK
jgi:exosome complex exonuclease RRP6